MNGLGLWRFNTRIGPCSGTETIHQHPFWAGSSSARVFTVADFLVRISAGLEVTFLQRWRAQTTKLDRLARNTRDLLKVLATISEREEASGLCAISGPTPPGG
jgi:hypothetical protein